MPTNAANSIPTSPNALGKENELPNQSPRLSRSPHPYHRDKRFLSSLTPIIGTSTGKEDASRPNGISYFDVDSRTRRKSVTSPSDSGTEADDERGGILRGLPAPPIKQRKGLKALSAISSPLLTPSYLDDETQRPAQERQLRRRKSLQSPSVTDEERLKTREKFAKRRRAELLRRVTEILLLGSVGCIACGSVPKLLLRTWAKGSHVNLSNRGTKLKRRLAELLAHGSVISSIYLLYPFRLFYYNRARGSYENKVWHGIRIPAAFDPAPLLYPVLIPVLVAFTLAAANPMVILPNVVLSISSMPHQIIPLSEGPPGYSSVQWLLSLLPLAVSQKKQSLLIRTTHDHENLMLLYPLHQSLMHSIGCLTTTSLLPAELQLLSVSMINLFFLATSPQAVILKALLWIGGLSIFIFCGTVLKWEVALARVPSWRFRHPRRRSRRGYVVFSALDDYFKGRLHEWGLVSGLQEASDSDEPRKSAMYLGRNKRHDKLNIDAGREEAVKSCLPSTLLPFSAIDDDGSFTFSNINGTLGTFQAQLKSQRRHTLPSYVGVPPGNGKELRKSKSLSTKPRSFLSLTEAQATVVKWFNALYVYTVVFIIIVTSMRTYVSRWALNGREPVGWALGYLLGDLPLFRSYTISFGLENWICLPQRFDNRQIWKEYGMADPLLEVYLGAANIRLLICAYDLGAIAVGLAIVFRLSGSVEVDTRRKVFHGMMVAMLFPTIFVDPTFAALALILVLAIFLLLDLFRASQLPPVSKPLTYFLAPYVDGRDHRGPVIVSHIFLLIGCAVPLWLSLAATEHIGEPPWEGWDVMSRDLSMISGVVCVGMGDAAASLVGRRYGRRRWCWGGGKSFEGSLAFAAAVILGLGMGRLWLLIGGWDGDTGDAWALTLGKAAVAAAGASLTEAVLTGGNDNVIVPVVLWLLVKGLRM